MLRARSLIVACLAACLVPLVASGATETEKFHKVVPLGPGGTVQLNSFSGTVRITGGDAGQVVIDAVRRAERDRLDHIKLDVQASGSNVIIEANRKDPGWEHEKNNNVVETDFEIQVPRDARLDVHVFSSPVRVTGVSGVQQLKTFSGTIEVEDAPGQVTAETFSGRVDVKLAPAAVEPTFTIRTFSGPIALTVPDAIRGRLEFNTFSGDLRSDLPVTLQRQSRRHLIADIGGGGSGRVELKTFSGDVRILK